MNRAIPIVAVVAMVALSGCVGSIPGLGGGGGGSAADPVEHVPSGVDAVVTVDASVGDDENTRALLNTLFEEGQAAPGDPQNVDEAVEQYQRQFNENLTANLSLDEVNAVAVFGQTPDSPQAASEQTSASDQYAGVILSVDWNREDVLTNVRESSTVTESTYEGVTIYEIENESAETPVYAAEYETGLWAFAANQGVVEDVIDVSQGNAESFGGDLRTAFDQTRDDAYVRYATTVSDEQREIVRQYAALYGAQAPVDLTQFGDVTAYAGSYYTEGEDVGLSTHLTATNETSAERLNQTLGSLITLGQGTVEPGSNAEKQLDALSTEQEGDTLTITYQIEVETLQQLIREQTGGGSTSLAPALFSSGLDGVRAAG